MRGQRLFRNRVRARFPWRGNRLKLLLAKPCSLPYVLELQLHLHLTPSHEPEIFSLDGRRYGGLSRS